MATARCPQCDTVLTAAEAAAGTCPECAAPLAGSPDAVAIPEALPVGPARGRGWSSFLAGLAVGILLAGAGVAGWWAWGPVPFPATRAERPAAAEAPADGQAADERAQAAQAVAREARDAARQADAEREATEQRLTTLRNQVQAALGQLAAAEQERSAAESRVRTAQDQAAALEKSATEAEARLQALKGKEADASVAKTRAAAQQAEAQRAAAERALVDVRNRLQAAQAQHGEAERQLAAANTRLQAARDQATTLDKQLADKRAQLADLDRALAVKGARPAERPVGPPAPPAVAARDPAPPQGPKPKSAFARDWLVVGPFPAPDRKGHDKAFPPEADPLDPKKEFDAAGHKVGWKAHASPADYVDLADLFKTQDPAVGYAVCWVRASRARPIAPSLGSNDGIKVWVGGKLVIDRGVSRSAAPGQDRVTCNLADGWNEVRVKVDNTGGPWGFYLEVRDPVTDKPLAGLEVRNRPPDSKDKR